MLFNEVRMKVFGYELRKSADLTADAQIRYTNPQGPFTEAFNNWRFRKISGDFYEVLREAIPFFDSAIRRLISLNGTLKIIGDKQALVKTLEDFCLNVPVNDMQKGMHAFRQNSWNETFEQGLAISEFVTTPDLSDIAGIKVADSKYITFRLDKDGRSVPWYRYPLAFASTYPIAGTSGGAFGNANQVYTDPSQLMHHILNPRYGMPVVINGWNEIPLNMANKLYFSIDNENSDPYGTPLFRSTEFCASILATLQTSMKNTADRFGDPVFHAHYSGNSKSENAETRRTKLEETISRVLGAKRRGMSGDIVTAGGADSKVEIKVVGHEGQLFQYEIPTRHALEGLVSKTGLPAWMLGIYWSTTERMATLEVETVLQDAKIRQLTEIPETMRLLSTVLKLRGYKWQTTTLSPDIPGDWGFYYETPNLHDIVAQAQAEFLKAQARMMRLTGQPGAGQVVNQDTQVQVGGQQLSVEIGGMKFPVLHPVKAAAVPMFVEYGGKKYSLTELPAAKFTIATDPGSEVQGPVKKLPLSPVGDDPSHPVSSSGTSRGEGTVSKAAHKKGLCSCGKSHGDPNHEHKELQRPIPWPRLDAIEAEYEKELKYDWNELKQKVFKIAGLSQPMGQGAGNQGPQKKDSPDPGPGTPDPFSFSDDQRKQIMDALKQYLGYYDPTDPDSSVRWAYMQAYSAGLIQAAHLVGKDRPLLDILKNKEVFDQLAQNGFDLVSSDAKDAVKNIIQVMEDGVTNGVNPLDVASDLESEFSDMDTVWERLARTEMGAAAENAKKDEWDARGVDTSGFVNGPAEIHPNCRCSNSVEDDGNGNLRTIFVPAPDACDACFAAAEGTKVA